MHFFFNHKIFYVTYTHCCAGNGLILKYHINIITNYFHNNIAVLFIKNIGLPMNHFREIG